MLAEWWTYYRIFGYDMVDIWDLGLDLSFHAEIKR